MLIHKEHWISLTCISGHKCRQISTERQPDWLTDWLTSWPTYLKPIDWLTNLPIKLIYCLLTRLVGHWLTCRPANWLLTGRLAAWLTVVLTDPLTGGLTHWRTDLVLTVWVTVWLTDWPSTGIDKTVNWFEIRWTFRYRHYFVFSKPRCSAPHILQHKCKRFL